MPSSLTSGGHYLEKHPAYNLDDLSANIVSNFNNYDKSWLMHAHNIRAISGDDLILEVSGNNRIVFYENDHSFNLCDLVGFKILNKNLTATDANVRIPISANNYSFADPTSLLTSLTLNGSYVDLTGAGYTLKYAPSTINSKVHVRAKINYKSSAGTEQLITFRLMRDISGGSTGDILMTDSSLGSITGVTTHGIYNLEYLDSPVTQEDVRYYLKFRIEAPDSDIVVSSGVLGYNNGNHNFFSAQEIYIPATYQYVPKDCACDQMINYQDSLVVAGGSGTNTLVRSLNNGEEWIPLGNGVITNTCNDIVWSTENNKFIAVGSGANTIVYSARDATEWRDVSLSTNIFSTSGNGVTWSGLRFVAVGEGTNTIAHSGDGLYWRTVPNSTSIFSTRGNKVAYGNNRYIAVGQGTNTIAYSDDGMNWIGLGSSIFSTAGHSIIWNGDRWVAGGQGTNTLAISNDNGYSWIGLGTSIFSTKVMGLGTNDMSMVAVGTGTNTIAYSSDNGLNWTGTTSVFGGSSSGNSVSWVGDRFIATSNDATHTTGYSYDGINWTGLGNDELTTTANAVATNKAYLGLNDKFYLLTGLGLDASFRHIDISGVLEVSGNAQIDNVLIDTNTISTTDATGHLHVLATNGAMNTKSNLDMSLISVTGIINIESHQNTNVTSQNADVNITSSTQDVNISSHQQTNITSQTSQTNMTAHQQNNITAQNGQTTVTSHQNFEVQAQNGDVNLVSSAQDVNITSHQNTNILAQTGDVNITSSAQDVNVTSHQQMNVTSQNAQTNLSGLQQVNVVSQTAQVIVTSSQGNIQMTSHQQTTIASQNSNVSIQSTGAGTTQIGPSLTVDNVLIDGNSISEQGGGGLQLQSATSVVAISSGGGNTTISPSLQVDNINIDSNVIKSNTSTIDFNNNTLTNVLNMTVGGVQNSFVPAGIIVMWSGSDGGIPTGWALCNGGNGTPDLRGRFILASTYGGGIGGLFGAGTSTNHSTGQTGGLHDHVLSIAEMPGHNHGASSQNTDVNHNHGASSQNTDVEHLHAASSQNTDVEHLHAASSQQTDVNHNHGATSDSTQSTILMAQTNVNHAHTLGQHNHQGGSHTHAGAAHTHGTGQHSHTQNSHSHEFSIGNHNHPGNVNFRYSSSEEGDGHVSILTDDQDFGTLNIQQVGGGVQLQSSGAHNGDTNSSAGAINQASAGNTGNANAANTGNGGVVATTQVAGITGATVLTEETKHNHSLAISMVTNTNIAQTSINHNHVIQTQQTSIDHNHVIQTQQTSIDHNHVIQTQQTSINHNHVIQTQQTGGGGYHNNRPAYYVLAFIMKL